MISFVISIVLSLVMAIPRFGASTNISDAINALANADPHVEKSVNNTVSVTTSSWDEFEEIMEHCINEVFRSASFAQLETIWGVSSNHGTCRYTITSNMLTILIKEDEQVQIWLQNNMPSIVPDGTTKDMAIQIIFDYILNNFYYDSACLTLTEYQGASAMLRTGRGVCTSYAKVFRVMVEYLSFKDNCVDYKNGKEYIKVACIEYSDIHIWNAIQEDDIWYCYDLTFADTANKSKELYYRQSLEQLLMNQGYAFSPDILKWRY